MLIIYYIFVQKRCAHRVSAVRKKGHSPKLIVFPLETLIYLRPVQQLRLYYTNV